MSICLKKKEGIPEFSLDDITITNVKKMLSQSEIHVDSAIYIQNFHLLTHIWIHNEYPPTTLLCAAVLIKDHKLIDYLLSQNADINLVVGQTNALQIAATRGDEQTFKKLYHLGADIHFEIPATGYTPLKRVFEWNRCYDLVKYLIDNGENLNKVQQFTDDNLIIKACESQSDVRVIKLVLDHVDYSKLIIDRAIMTSHLNKDTFQLLMALGADVNYKYSCSFGSFTGFQNNYSNLTVIHRALTRGRKDFLEYLLSLDEPNTYINIITDKQQNLLHFGLLRSLLFDEYGPLLLDAGVDVNAEDSDGILAVEYNEMLHRKILCIPIIKQHIIKLLAVGLPVCEKNRQAVGKNFQDFESLCLKEVQKMKINKIGRSNIFFFDVFQMSFHYLAVRLKFAELDKVIDDEKLRIEYPEYGGMIYFKLSKVERRIKYLEVLENFVEEILHKWGLPYTFIRELWYYFTNIELKKFVINLNKKI